MLLLFFFFTVLQTLPLHLCKIIRNQCGQMSCLSLTSKKMEGVLYFEADISWPSYLSSCLSLDCTVFFSFTGVFYAAFIFHLMNWLELIADTKLSCRRKLSRSSPLRELKSKTPSLSNLVPGTSPLGFVLGKAVERSWKRGCSSIHFELDTQSWKDCVTSYKASKEWMITWCHKIIKSLWNCGPCLYSCYVYEERKMNET